MCIGDKKMGKWDDPEFRKEYYKNYYSKPENKKRRYENNKRWRLKNRERYLELTRRGERRRRLKIRGKIIELLGGKCSNPNCAVPNGMTDKRCLQIDHIKGSGKKERNKFGSSANLLRHILKKLKAGSKDYQLLCANCNWIKRWENKEWGREVKDVED